MKCLHAEESSTESRKFNPDVALINFYKEGDTLGGHLDDVEKDLEKPIVSFSLGCEAIFLIGGRQQRIQEACNACIVQNYPLAMCTTFMLSAISDLPLRIRQL